MRACGGGSRRAPCCSSAPHANAAWCPSPRSTSSAARAPGCPARHDHSAPKPRTVPTPPLPRSRLADAESARAGPARAGSASDRNEASPPRTRSARRVSPASRVSEPSARQRPRRSTASSSARGSMSSMSSRSSEALACTSRPPASTPRAAGPASARAPTILRLEKLPARTEACVDSHASPEPERPRKRAWAPRSSALRLHTAPAPPSASPLPHLGASRPAASEPPANGASTRPPVSASSPSRSVPRVPPPRKLTRCERLTSLDPRLAAPTATSSSWSASESAASSV